MNLNPDALRSRFLRFHEATLRNVQNRDKAIIDGGNGFVGRPRSYFSPTKWEWARRERGTSKYVLPAADTDWEFWLYRTCIVRVDAKGVVSLHLDGWLTALTLSYVREITNLHFYRQRPNQWTPYVLCTKHQDVLLPYVEGMKFRPDFTPINPTTVKVFKPDFTHPDVKNVQQKLKEIKARYLPLAQLHATTSKGVDPFEGITASSVQWEELIDEVDAKVETYVSLVEWNGPKAYYKGMWKWHGDFPAVKRLNRSLEHLRKEQYKKYLKEVKE